MTGHQRQAIRRALRDVARLVREVKSFLKPGVTEQAVSEYLRRRARTYGYARLAFPTIIATGSHAYDFHHQPTATRVQFGDLVVVDFGVRVAGTCTDLTRTFSIGRPTPRQRKIYTAVHTAHAAAVRAVRPGTSGRDVDTAARQVLTQHRLARAFRHSTGHGVGYRIHQRPYLGPRSVDHLRRGQIVTIEPGAYLRGWGGIRIEDMVEVTATGARVLSAHIPTDLRAMTIAVTT